MRHSQAWPYKLFYKKQWLAVGLIVLCLQLAACAQGPAAPETRSSPARVEASAGSEFSRVILTADAARRLGIETTQLAERQVGGKMRQIVPYSAVLYDLHGQTWVYTSPAPLTYIRSSVSVDSIDRDLAVLAKGPPSGTLVVTVGTPELYGTETGVGE